MSKNKYNLGRKINPKITKRIRKRCGFGCVMCGCSIIEYHHFNPPFADAKFHDENGITLLCGTCHDKAHKGIISYEIIVNANNNPYCNTKGNAKDILYLGNVRLPVKIGSSTIHSRTVFLYDSQIIFGFNEPELKNGPIRLNAIITNEGGNEILKIENNEWIIGSNCFDVIIEKSSLKIKNEQNDVIFDLNLAVNKTIEINQLDMNYKGFKIKIENGIFNFTTPSGSRFSHIGENYSDVAFWMKSNGHAKIATNRYGGGSAVYI